MAVARVPAAVNPWTADPQLSRRPSRSNTRIKQQPGQQDGQLHMAPWAQASLFFLIFPEFSSLHEQLSPANPVKDKNSSVLQGAIAT